MGALSNEPKNTPLFAMPATQPSSSPLVAWGIAGAIVLVLLGCLLLFTHRQPAPPAGMVLALDPYAANLAITGIVMSESTSLAGGKSTFIDGHVQNKGSRTVTGATVQVLFGNFDTTQPPQIDITPLTLIRTHDPYIDIEPLGSAPLAPGDDREFRLIFEDVSPNWNQQIPEIHPVKIATKH